MIFFLVQYHITFEGMHYLLSLCEGKNLYCQRLQSEDHNSTHFIVLCKLNEFVCERLRLTSWLDDFYHFAPYLKPKFLVVCEAGMM